MVYTKNFTNVSSGTVIPFASSRTPCGWVQVTALNSNTGDVWVAGVDPTTKQIAANAASQVGYRIAKGTTQLVALTQSATDYVDLATIGFDAATNGDKVSVTWGVR